MSNKWSVSSYTESSNRIWSAYFSTGSHANAIIVHAITHAKLDERVTRILAALSPESKATTDITSDDIADLLAVAVELQRSSTHRHLAHRMAFIVLKLLGDQK